MTSRDAVFVESVSAMLKLAQSDPEKARVALVARGDQVLAALRDSMLPEAKDSARIVALIDLYVQATFEMLVGGGTFGRPDRVRRGRGQGLGGGRGAGPGRRRGAETRS